MRLVLAILLLPALAFASSAPRSAELPSADRIAPWIRAHVGDRVSDQVRVCVATDGHVTSVRLVRPSSYSAFDNAVVTDVAQWKFAPVAEPRCMVRTVEYDTIRD
jgi:TonB family protein